MTSTATTTTADLYLRLSDLRPCDACRSAGAGCEHNTLAAKEKLLRDKASGLGWGVHRVAIENDVNGDGKLRPASAFKRRKIVTPSGKVEYRTIMPAFRSMLDDLMAGRANGVLAEDLDRTNRQPRDLEDLIDVVEAHRINARSLSGSLTFTDGGTDAEITMARIMVAIANKSSRDTARRVAQSRERRAAAGTNGGGRRSFGFCADGVTVDEAEATVIREAAEAVLRAPVSHAARSNPALTGDAVTLKALARDLRERGVASVTGAPWTPDTLQAILVRPKNAGLRVYKGQILEGMPDNPPAWMTDPILPRDVWEAVVTRLSDPARKTSTGNAVKWLGSGIYRCGVCNDGTVCRVGGSGAGRPRYQCAGGRGAHLGRAAVVLDDWVSANVIQGLHLHKAQPVKPSATIDAPALRRQLKIHEARLTEIAKDADDDLVTRAQFLTQTANRRKKIAAIDAQLAEANHRDPFKGLAGEAVGVIRQAWDHGLSLEEKRVILRALYVVTIKPTGRGRGFDHDSVDIVPAGI